MSLKKYIQVAHISWENGFVYRLNFFMWRVRSIIQLLILYFLWLAITKDQPNTFGYTQAEMLTYIILGSSVLQVLVFGIRSIDIQGEISSGDLNNYLLKPFNYFYYWFSRDLSDKALNLIFVILELLLFIFFFKSPIFIQTNPIHLISFLLAIFLAVIMYFFFSLIISLTTFWYPEHDGWPQRFMLNILIQFLSGRVFPLNILPKPAFTFLKNLPTSFFIFTPLQIYLGKLSGFGILQNLIFMSVWIFVLYAITQLLWSQGRKIYGAYGR